MARRKIDIGQAVMAADLGYAQKIRDNLHSGAVILLHPTSATNAKILPELIDELRAQGYRFGTLDELTGRNGK